MAADIKRGRTHVASRAFNEMSIGTDAERSDGFDPHAAQTAQFAARNLDGAALSDFAGSLIGELSIPVASGRLTGYLYRPDPAVYGGVTSGPAASRSAAQILSSVPDDEASSVPAAVPVPQKAVIFLSGSAGSNASMAGQAAAQYNRMGALVIGVDYRGFGNSNNRGAEKPLTGANITESSIYQDSIDIYEYVKTALGFAPGDIIIHGFSLGGASASYLAAWAAERGDRPGGLVLHSAIRDMTGAAAGTLPLVKPLAYAAGALGGLLTGGAYSTKNHLKRLVKYDPAIPLHFRGGSKASGDQLGLDETKLDRIGVFSHRTVYTGNEGHQSSEPGSKTAANMSAGPGDLEAMVNTRRR